MNPTASSSTSPASAQRSPWVRHARLLVLAATVVPVVMLALATVAHTPALVVANDTASYLRPGVNLWNGVGYGHVDPWGRFVPELNRTPGYALLLGLFGKFEILTPIDEPQKPRVLVAVLVQALLRGGTGLLVLASALALTGCARETPSGEREKRQVILLVTLCLLTEASGALLATKLLSETLTTTMIAFTVWLLAGPACRRAGEGAALGWLLVAGGIAGAATLCRPIAVVLIPVWLLWILFVGGESVPGWKGRAVRVGVFMAGVALALVPWMARNAAYVGKPVLSLTSSINLRQYRAAAIEARQTGKSFEEVRRALVAREDAERRDSKGGMTEWMFAERRTREAKEILLAHPGWVVADAARGFARGVFGLGGETWRQLGRPAAGGSPAAGDVAGGGGGIAKAWGWFGAGTTLLHLALLYGTVGRGALRIWRRGGWRDSARKRAFLCLGLGALALIAAAAGPETNFRFRVPATPLLVLAAVIALREASDESAADQPRAQG